MSPVAVNHAIRRAQRAFGSGSDTTRWVGYEPQPRCRGAKAGSSLPAAARSDTPAASTRPRQRGRRLRWRSRSCGAERTHVRPRPSTRGHLCKGSFKPRTPGFLRVIMGCLSGSGIRGRPGGLGGYPRPPAISPLVLFIELEIALIRVAQPAGRSSPTASRLRECGAARRRRSSALGGASLRR